MLTARDAINKIITFLFIALFFILIFDPSNKIFKLKEVVFILIVLFFTLYCFINKFFVLHKDIFFVYIVLGLIIPTYGYTTGFIRDINFLNDFALSYLKAFSMLFILVIWYVLKIDCEKTFIFLLTLLSVVILSIYIAASLELDNIWFIIDWLSSTEKDAAWIGVRQFGDLSVPFIFYKTSPLIVFAISFYLDKEASFRDIALSIICSLALFLSGTRANMLAAVILPVCAGIVLIRIKTSFKVFFVSVIIIAQIVLIPSFRADFIDPFIDPDEYGNAIKLGHVSSYIEVFGSDAWALIIGQGVGSGFYSIGFGRDAHITELTYYELIRHYGIFIALIIIILLWFPIIRIWRKSRIKAVSYGLYLIIGGTNPLIFGSTGMMAIAYGYYLAYIYGENYKNISIQAPYIRRRRGLSEDYFLSDAVPCK